MKRNAFAFLLLCAAALPASAAPVVTGIAPAEGFYYAPTTVTIYGIDMVDAPFVCNDPCNSAAPCPIRVTFGGVAGTVLSAAPDRIVVIAPPHGEESPFGATVPVLVFSPGRTSLRTTFYYSPRSDDPESYVRYLLPLLPARAGGALGSLWETRLVVRNGSEHPLVPLPVDADLRMPPPPVNVVAPGQTRDDLRFGRIIGGDGGFLYIPRPLDDAASMTLRVRDTSRAAEGLGTEVPIVPPGDFRTRVNLLSVPTDARYRATLRIYGDQLAPMPARVRLYREGESVPFSEQVVQLSGFISAAPIPFPPSPAYAQLDPLTPAARAAGERLRVEVASEWDVKLWAMLSITNNETQQVTLITPHR